MHSTAIFSLRPCDVLRAAGIALLASLLPGCMSTPATRIQENLELFQSLDAFSQKIVKEGLVNYGFSAAVVCLALGKPNRVSTVLTVDSLIETWSYRNFLYATPNAAQLGAPFGLHVLVSPTVAGGVNGPEIGNNRSGFPQSAIAISDGSNMPIGTLLLGLVDGRVTTIRLEP